MVGTADSAQPHERLSMENEKPHLIVGIDLGMTCKFAYFLSQERMLRQLWLTLSLIPMPELI